MTDDFDREAEREKLREKYERDKQKREATEQMSELLLQGATMTNRHCPECHSPVFRYDGREFCPTCQREVTEEGELVGEEGDAGAAAANGETGGTDADAGAETGADASPETPDTGAEAAGGAESRPGAAGADARGDAGAGEGRERDATGEPTVDERGRSEASDPAETRPAPTRDRRPARVDPPARREGTASQRERAEGGDLAEAEASLVREITSLTRRAEETRDVGRKRDLYAAAREATETLRELRRL